MRYIIQMSYTAKRNIVIITLLISFLAAFAQDNDKILNRPYADMKKVHFGFSVGMNFQDLNITNNGLVTDDGQSWFADIPSHSPGFCVNVLADLRLSRYFNLRFNFTAGVMGVYDVGKERSEQLRLKNFNTMLTVGMGCDIYLPFFKLCPELKFCFGLRNLLEKNRPDLQDNPDMMKFTNSVSKVLDNMVVLTFYFE